MRGKVKHDAKHRKGCQMGYRAMFVIGFAAGYVLGTRAGRERYEQIVKYSKQVAEHPAVQKATQTVTTKTTEVTTAAMAKAPDFAKTAGAQIVTSAKQAASRLPSRGGKSEPGGTGDETDDVSADGHLIYPAEDGEASVDGVRYTT